MGNERANLGFVDELESFNPSEWDKPKKKPRPAPDVAQKAATATGFKSREPTEPEITPALQRRRRTGRNTQFNIKAKPETIAAFCAVADSQGWGLGETLEYAVTLLADSYGADKG
ncbi:hypothetical protein [Ruegeria sp.]|uniref:hypothetical protein n=1 Tax=Ruegeria sp. TaxID=1879320 RepID=UPI003AFFE63D